ncbi:MAG: LysM peptidoglycan-binding domain-containing protein [Pseudomonadota bacterium]
MRRRRLSTVLAVAFGALAITACTAPRGPASVGVVYGPGADANQPAPIRQGDGGFMPGAPLNAVHHGCGARYTVTAGDTLSGVSERCGVGLYELAEANNLQAPFTLQAGQVLSLPQAETHTVQRGENLYRIALSYGMTTEEMAALNGIDAPYTIHPGQELRVTAMQLASAPPVTPAPVRTDPTPSTRPPARVETTPVSNPQPAPAPSRSAPPPQAGAFVWPLGGDVVESFGPQDGGRRNDGLKIAASVGDPVVAAAPGKVIYAGDDLQNFGQLVLIRHSGGYVTAYAHNSVLRVAENADVDAGDVIAEAGQTGAVDRPMLHFEVRRNMSPIDPMEVLAPRS